MKKNGEEKLNKSRVCRDFWRKVFADDLCNLRNSDERKEIVDQFFADPANKGWNRTKDKRFMRSAFAKVAKENNFNIMQLGITPTPSRSKRTAPIPITLTSLFQIHLKIIILLVLLSKDSSIFHQK